jgi:ADP-ribose pyrophosphatase
MLKPWQKVSSQPLGDFKIFRLRSDQAVSPRTGQPHNFIVIDSVNWVNVVAVTPGREVVMIEQFRHGSRTIELEIPGGMIDPHDSSPEDAGIRELREETGYAGKTPRIIGHVLPNPAIMSNHCFTVLLEDCQCLHPVEFDRGEDLITRLVPISEIPNLVGTGKIRHSLVVAGLYYFDLWTRGMNPAQ